MSEYGWYHFEWDDENKKTGMSNICAITASSRKKRKNVFTTITGSVKMTGDLMMFIYLGWQNQSRQTVASGFSG